jgi:uncharacterized protein YukE
VPDSLSVDLSVPDFYFADMGKSVASVNYADTERQFNQSIEDLQNLARDVEDKLSQIKCKIVDADENESDLFRRI